MIKKLTSSNKAVGFNLNNIEENTIKMILYFNPSFVFQTILLNEE